MEATAIRHHSDGKKGILTEGSLVLADLDEGSQQVFIEEFTDAKTTVTIRTLTGFRIVKQVPLIKIHLLDGLADG